MNLQKTYLSREMTRAMALDHPIGDPFGGPAYGERRDPVSAIVAIGSMMATAGTAATLAAGFTWAGLAAGVAFAGGALSLVGNVTGNKSLMKVGSVAMLAGGLGMAAESFFSGAELAKAAGPGSSGWGADLGQEAVAGSASAAPGVSESIVGTANPNVTLNTAAAENIAAPTALADAGASTASIAAESAPAATAAAGGAPAVPVDAAAAGSQVGSAAGSQVGSAAGSEGLLSSANPNLGGYQAIPNTAGPGQAGSGWQYFSDPATNQGVAISPDGTYYGNGAGNAAMRQVTGANGGQMSFMDKAAQGFKDLMPDTSNMSTMDKFLATKIGAEVVGGITSYVAPNAQQKAQTAAMQAQAASAQAQADKLKADEALRQKRLAALNQNMSANVSMGQVNPNAVTFAAPTLRTGLINSARTA